MAKPRWSDAVREQREGPAPEPEARERHGRCKCGCGRFGLCIRERILIRTCKECGEEQAV